MQIKKLHSKPSIFESRGSKVLNAERLFVDHNYYLSTRFKPPTSLHSAKLFLLFINISFILLFLSSQKKLIHIFKILIKCL